MSNDTVGPRRPAAPPAGDALEALLSDLGIRDEVYASARDKVLRWLATPTPYPRGPLANARRIWLHYRALGEAGQPADAAVVARDIEPIVAALERACDAADGPVGHMERHVERQATGGSEASRQRRSGLYWVHDPDDPRHPTVARWDADREAWWRIGAEVPYPGDLTPLDSLVPPPYVLPARSVADVIADAAAAGEPTDWPLVGHGYRDRSSGASYVVADVEPLGAGGRLTDAHRSGGRLCDDPDAWTVRVRYHDG